MMYRADLAGITVLQPAFGALDGLNISGLSVALAQPNAPIAVRFTASAFSAGGFLGGGLVDQTVSLGGVVVNANNIVVANFVAENVTVGPNGLQGGAGQSAYVQLQSTGAVPSADLGANLSAWVGLGATFSAIAVGDTFFGNTAQMLETNFVIQPPSGVTPSPSQGGSPTATGGAGNVPITSGNAGNILTWVGQHWQVVALGVGALLVAPPLINAIASTTVAEKRLQAARGSA